MKTPPICIGPPLISILAKAGHWVSEDGSGLVAADGLFKADPYEEIASLKSRIELQRQWHKRRDLQLNEASNTIAALRQTNDELQDTFRLMYAANVRGIKLWQEQCSPEREMQWPDQAQLVAWLLKQVALLQGEVVEEKSTAIPTIHGKDPYQYILEQFPATEGHLPLKQWFNELKGSQ